MCPHGSVGAHIKTGKRYMAEDHFKTPPDPKKGHGMPKHPQKSKKSSRVGQAYDIYITSLHWRSLVNMSPDHNQEACQASLETAFSN